MGHFLKLAPGVLVAGLIMGLPVLAAAAVSGQQRRRNFFLGGAAWGAVAAGLMLTDCLPGARPGPVSEASFPIFFLGLVAWPAAAVWRRPRWYLRWLAAQALMLLCILPGYIIAVAAALCNLTIP